MSSPGSGSDQPAKKASGRTGSLSSSVKRISGPVSVHVFAVPSDKDFTSAGKTTKSSSSSKGGDGSHRVIIFGDEHFSYEEMCAPCRREDGCSTITSYIREALRKSKQSHTSLDVFIELPYVTRKGPVRDSVLRILDEKMAKDPGPDGSALKSLFNRMMGVNVPYIGVVSQLYNEFRDEFYDDEIKLARLTDGDAPVRFHASDARFEPHVRSLLRADAQWLHKHIVDTAHLRGLLRAFLFSKDFLHDVDQAFQWSAATSKKSGSGSSSRKSSSVFPGVLSFLGPEEGGAGLKVHKIAKQFLKLKDGKVKDAVRQYLEDRLDDLIDTFQKVLLYDHADTRTARRSPKRSPTRSVMEAWIGVVHGIQEKVHTSVIPMAMHLGVWVLLMDAYLLCRLVRFSMQRVDTVGGTSIVYVGDVHSQMYVTFFRDYLRLAPTVCQELGSGKSVGSTTDAKRCAKFVACSHSYHASKPSRAMQRLRADVPGALINSLRNDVDQVRTSIIKQQEIERENEKELDAADAAAAAAAKDDASDAGTDADTRSVVDVDVDADTDALTLKLLGKPQQARPQQQQQVKSQTQALVKSQTQAQVKPQTQAQVKPQTQAQVKPQTQAQSQVKPQTQAQSQVKSQAPAMAQVKTKPDGIGNRNWNWNRRRFDKAA